MKKGFIKLVLSVMFVLSLTVSTLAAEINCSPWAREYVENAAEKNLVPEELLKKADSVATRKEFCELIIAFYEAETGINYEVTTESPFEDEKSKVVVAAVELGLFSGVSETKFDPNGKVTREQMATVITRLSEKLLLPLLHLQSSNEKFSDDENIAQWANSSVYLLKRNAIITGDETNRFNPKGETTIEQIIVVLSKIQGVSQEPIQTSASKSDEYSSPNIVKVGDINVVLGESKEGILTKFGQPNRIDIGLYGFERYVYNSDYSKFIMIGIDEGKVVEIYTNAASFSYGKISPSTKFSDLNFKNFAEYSSEKAIYKSDIYQLKIFFDISDAKNVDGIYLLTCGYSEMDGIYNITNETMIEKELLDIINSARVKYGFVTLERNPVSDEVAKNHSLEMKSVQRGSYNSLRGLNPFSRMLKAGIEFSLAAENISVEASGDAIDIYAWWMSHIATRVNLLDESFTHAGIGVAGAAANGRFYATIDLYCE